MIQVAMGEEDSPEPPKADATPQQLSLCPFVAIGQKAGPAATDKALPDPINGAILNGWYRGGAPRPAFRLAVIG